jgi:hypothetical protein
MEDTSVILYATTLSKDQLEDGLRDYESGSGSVVAIGAVNDADVGNWTAATFDNNALSPEKDIKVLPIIDGHFSMPAGAGEVCRGFAFLAGAATPVVLAR